MTTTINREGSTDTLTPTLVINYQHAIDTGVVVHQPINGFPLLVRRYGSPRLPSGKFEMFCATEELALEVALMCNGEALVELVSDDVPGAPFTFSPTDAVGVAWNQPYDSWTATVPYQRLT